MPVDDGRDALRRPKAPVLDVQRGAWRRLARAAALRRVFDVLGLDIVVVDSAVPQVVAELESGKGTTVLTSFTPLPRGYVI